MSTKNIERDPNFCQAVIFNNTSKSFKQCGRRHKKGGLYCHNHVNLYQKEAKSHDDDKSPKDDAKYKEKDKVKEDLDELPKPSIKAIEELLPVLTVVAKPEEIVREELTTVDKADDIEHKESLENLERGDVRTSEPNVSLVKKVHMVKIDSILVNNFGWSDRCRYRPKLQKQSRHKSFKIGQMGQMGKSFCGYWKEEFHLKLQVESLEIKAKFRGRPVL